MQAVNSFKLIKRRWRMENHRGVYLISDALPFGRLWDGGPDGVSNAVDYAKFYSLLTQSWDSLLRCCRQCDRDARAQGRFQRPVNGLAILQPFNGHFHLRTEIVDKLPSNSS